MSYYNQKENVSQLPIYIKALEIFSLCRNVSSYLTENKNILKLQQSSNNIDQNATVLILNSLALPQEIVAIATTNNPVLRANHLASLQYLVSNMVQKSKRLETLSNTGKDYIHLLQQELYKLKKLHSNWTTTIN